MHVIPDEAHAAAKAQSSSLGPANLLCILTFNFFGMLVSNVKRAETAADGRKFYLVDGLVNKQGPNYALAKRMQHWRAVVAREEHRCRVSSNIAPSTATASVVSNRLFAMAYGGMAFFKPMEVFQQETSNAVMGAILISDVCNPSTPSNPTLPIKNPLSLFSYGSFHGGVWRMAYTIDSIGTPSVLVYVLMSLMRVLSLILLGAGLALMVVKANRGENPMDEIQSFLKNEL